MSPVDQWEKAMELTLDAPGATSEQLARGLAAARRVFAAAGVSALEAAVGDYEREGWDVRDFEGDVAGRSSPGRTCGRTPTSPPAKAAGATWPG
jgi:hypothetical protein